MNRTTGRVLAREARVARSLRAQLTGWIGRDIPEGAALGLPRCPVVHTLFVRFPLDVAFCDSAGRVLRLAADRKPGGLGPCVRGAALVWEARAGTLAPFVRVGDILTLESY